MFFNKKDYLSYFEDGESKYELEDYEGAIDDFTNSIEKNSDFEKSYYWRAHSKSCLEDDEGAIDDFTKAIEIRSEFVDAYGDRGVCKGQLGDFEGFQADFKKALELASKYSSTEELDSLYGLFYYTHAHFKNLKGDFTGAKNDLNTAVSYGCEEAKQALLTYDTDLIM